MKIAALYAFHCLDRGWSCPISILNQFEKIGHQVSHFNLYMLDQSGKGVGYTDRGLLELIDQQNDFEFCILFDYGQFFSPLLANIDIPLIQESGDDIQAFQQNVRKAPYATYIITPDLRAFKKYRDMGYNAFHLPHWADPDIHYEREEVLQNYFITTTIDEGRGNGVVPYMRRKLGELWNDDRFFYGADYPKYMCKGHAVFQHSQFSEWTRRIPEACACKRLVFTDRIPEETGIYNSYKDGIDIVYYRSWPEAVKKIKYYNNHLDEVAKIAENGYNVTMANHTSIIRAKQILNLVECGDINIEQ